MLNCKIDLLILVAIFLRRSNDRSFGCPIIYMDTYSQYYFVLWCLNVWYNKAHSLIGKTYLAIIASNEKLPHTQPADGHRVSHPRRNLWGKCKTISLPFLPTCILSVIRQLVKCNVLIKYQQAMTINYNSITFIWLLWSRFPEKTNPKFNSKHPNVILSTKDTRKVYAELAWREEQTLTMNKSSRDMCNHWWSNTDFVLQSVKLPKATVKNFFHFLTYSEHPLPTLFGVDCSHRISMQFPDWKFGRECFLPLFGYR